MTSPLDRRYPAPQTQRTLLLLTILILAFALRMYRLDSQSFTSDEALSAYSASVPVPELFTGLPPDHTPGYFFLLQNWMRVAGNVDFSIRFFSVFFGVLSVALLFIVGQRLFSPRVGALAAMLAAVNPFAVYFSQEARMYSQVLAFGTAALYWFVRAYAQPHRRALWAAHAATLAAALYTHYYAFALPLAEGVWLIAERAGRSRARLAPWLFSIVGAGILFLPWTPLMPRVFIPRSWPGPIDPTTFPAQVWAVFLAGATMPDEATPLLFFLAAILLVYGILVARRSWQGRLIIVYLFVPLVGVLTFLTLRRNGIFVRYLTILLPAFVLLIAMGLERAIRLRPPLTYGGFAICSMLAILSLQNYYFDGHYSRPDWRDAAHWLTERGRPGDVILFDGADPTVEFSRYYRGKAKYVTVPGLKKEAAEARVVARMSPLVSGAPRAWLVLFSNSPGRAEEWLNEQGYQGDYEDFDGVYVFPYLFSTDLSPPIAPEQVQSGGEIELLNYRVGVARAGDLFPLMLTWRRGPGTLGIDYQASIRLIGAQDSIIVALDRAPRDGFHPTSTWRAGETVEDHYALLPPRDISSGNYTLRVLLYDPSNGVPHLDATLGTIQVGAAKSDK